MKSLSSILPAFALSFFGYLLLSGISSQAQCSVAAAPSYSASCSAEYFTTMSASGVSVVSTISLVGGTCSGTYFNNYATQGVTVTAGNTVNISFTRYTTTYTGYVTVYVDWNNDGLFTPGTELAGTMMTMPSSLLTSTYSFLVPSTGIVMGTHLHMRVMLSESASGAPCTANYGQAYDYYLQANCATTATVTVTPPSGSICAGGAGISFTATGAGTGTYTWAPATGLSSSTGATVTATPATTTTYTVTGTPTSGCSGTATATVTVNPLPSAVVTASGPLSFCSGDSVVLSAPLAAGYTYQWYQGTSALPGATSHTYSALTGGTYSVKVTSAAGCTATSAAFVISINPSVPVADTASGPLTFCAGDSVKLKATAGTGYTYQWMLNGTAIAGATNRILNATLSGSYTCNITIPTACASAVAAVVVTVHALPIPTISFNGKTLKTGSYYTSYQWSENGGAISGATHDSIIAHSNGNYTVKVTDTNGCSGMSAIFPVTHLAVPNQIFNSAASIYPNPAANTLNISSNEPVNIRIYGIDGKLLLQAEHADHIDISTLSAGLYVAELTDDTGIRVLISKLAKF